MDRPAPRVQTAKAGWTENAILCANIPAIINRDNNCVVLESRTVKP